MADTASASLFPERSTLPTNTPWAMRGWPLMEAAGESAPFDRSTAATATSRRQAAAPASTNHLPRWAGDKAEPLRDRGVACLRTVGRDRGAWGVFPEASAMALLRRTRLRLRYRAKHGPNVIGSGRHPQNQARVDEPDAP